MRLNNRYNLMGGPDPLRFQHAMLEPVRLPLDPPQCLLFMSPIAELKFKQSENDPSKYWFEGSSLNEAPKLKHISLNHFVYTTMSNRPCIEVDRRAHDRHCSGTNVIEQLGYDAEASPDEWAPITFVAERIRDNKISEIYVFNHVMVMRMESNSMQLTSMPPQNVTDYRFEFMCKPMQYYRLA